VQFCISPIALGIDGSDNCEAHGLRNEVVASRLSCKGGSCTTESGVLIETQLTNLSPRCEAKHELTPQVMGERVALSRESLKPEVPSGRRRWRRLAPWLIRSSTPL